MTKTLEELKQEADALDIKYVKNIGTEKLEQKIEDFYKSQAADSLPKVKEDVEVIETPTAVSKTEDARTKFKRESKERQAARMKKRIVTITSNDKRDNHVTTTAYLSCGTVSKIVPLDIPVELEEALIIIAKTTPITLHVDEVIDGKRTNNKVPKSIKKYNVSYEDMAAV